MRYLKGTKAGEIVLFGRDPVGGEIGFAGPGGDEIGFAGPGDGVRSVELEDGHEGGLGDLDGADLAHALFAFLLFL